ncbi:MAG TPA: NAD(P)/FAD-dependent oxidoreductase [Lactobacillus sp.]|nr:NAD(P)/FAD-dependent oxidoreductase [Lactobacillus sp.]
MKTYDYIFIGSGPVITGAQPDLIASHKRVLVIESDTYGGTCPNTGCEPKIFLEGTIKTILTARKLADRGVAGSPTVDWPKLMAAKQAAFKTYSDIAKRDFKQSGFDVVHGTGSFVDAHTISVNDEEYTAKTIIVATGERANSLPIPGAEYLKTNEDVFNLSTLPKHVVFIGAGYIGLELATVLHTAGAEVDIVEGLDRALGAFDADHVQVVVDEMIRRGIKFHFNEPVKAVTKRDDGYRVETTTGAQFDADYVVNVTGRVPNVEALQLDKAGIKFDRHGILVDDHMQTNVSGVYAAGDVVSKNPDVALKLAPYSNLEGRYIVKQLEAGTNEPLVYPLAASIAFTYPEIAQTGVSVATAKANPNKYVLKEVKFDQNFDYLGAGDDLARATLVFDQQHQLVGASEVGQQAADDINNFATIIGFKLNEAKMKETVAYAFPSLIAKIPALLV